MKSVNRYDLVNDRIISGSEVEEASSGIYENLNHVPDCIQPKQLIYEIDKLIIFKEPTTDLIKQIFLRRLLSKDEDVFKLPVDEIQEDSESSSVFPSPFLPANHCLAAHLNIFLGHLSSWARTQGNEALLSKRLTYALTEIMYKEFRRGDSEFWATVKKDG